jgi:Uma2 family endonuclease
VGVADVGDGEEVGRRCLDVDREQPRGYDEAIGQHGTTMSAIVVAEQARIPAGIENHRSFRRWIYSGRFPERGKFSYFKDELWLDVSMETDDHNQIKFEICRVLGNLISEHRLGRFYLDGMMLTNTSVRLSTEPDGMFVSSEALRSGRVKRKRGGESLEVMGTPDMVLEVVSKTTVRKDSVILPGLYFRAGIPEYWLVDSRPDQFRFDIFHPGRRKYVATRKSDGWIKSEVFGKSFKLVAAEGDDGTSEYRLESR